MCENHGWDIEFQYGHVGKIDVNIPWSSLMDDDSHVKIHDLYLEIIPKPRPADGATMIESMWSSMSSSMQLAKDCFGNDPDPQPLEGLERFAKVIDSGELQLSKYFFFIIMDCTIFTSILFSFRKFGTSFFWKYCIPLWCILSKDFSITMLFSHIFFSALDSFESCQSEIG